MVIERAFQTSLVAPPWRPPSHAGASQQLSPQRQRTGGEVEGLAALLESCKLEYLLDTARVWCNEQGFDSVGEIVEARAEARFIAALQLKPGKDHH